MGQWSKLPMDLLKVIEDHLVLYIDKVQIRAVCVAWNTYLPKLPNHQVKQFPWLLHPLRNNTEASHGLFNPIDKKVYEIYLPEARGKLFKGSSYGWLVTVEDIHSSSPTDIHLLNPITRAQIKLPQRTEFPDVVEYRPNEVDEEFILRTCYDVPNDYHFVEEFVNEIGMSLYDVSLAMTRKVVLSSAPCDECVVVAIYGPFKQLAWCRCNDKKWTHIYTRLTNFKDIVFHEGKLYALTVFGQLFMFENIGTDLDTKWTEIATSIPIPMMKSAYLAYCSDGSLIVVTRHFGYEETCREYLLRTIGFKVYKLDLLNSSWIEVKDIRNEILFLGFSSATSVSSNEFPGCKRNHIYFSDRCSTFDIVDKIKNSDADVGVFNLEDKSLEELLPGLQRRIRPLPIWVNVC